MPVERKVLLQFRDERHGVTFRVERWFVVLDHKMESIVRPCLVWEDDDGTERVVVMSSKELRAVMQSLGTFEK